MISVVLYGRNDNYGYNLHKRAALSLNCIAEVLTDPSDEILFVDYNTADDFPTFPEAIQDTLTRRAKRMLRIFRVRPHIHERFKSKTRLSALEPIARNVAIRRSSNANRWILSTNTDMIFVPLHRHSLSQIAQGLAPGFYHAPRIEIPEVLWESLNRNDPADVIKTVRVWGSTLHLNEIVLGSNLILYDGPGDFQLILRSDLFENHGFDEEMLLGWHVDSNIAARMHLKYKKVGDLGTKVYGYHCDHTRQVTSAHSHSRAQNDWRRFVTEVAQSDIAGQANTWGCSDDDIEETRLPSKPATAGVYVQALHHAIGDQLSGPKVVKYTGEVYNKADYDPRHILPFLADMFVPMPRNINIGWYGTRSETLSLFTSVWGRLGFIGRILLDRAALAPEAGTNAICQVSSSQALAEADVFVFDFAGLPPQNDQTTAMESAIAELRKSFRRAIRAERKRLASGGVPRRFVALNAINNEYEAFVCGSVAAAATPFATHMRHGFVLPASTTREQWLPLLSIGEAGVRLGDQIKSDTAKLGWIAYGPYKHLDEGTYIVSLNVELLVDDEERSPNEPCLFVEIQAGAEPLGLHVIRYEELKTAEHRFPFIVTPDIAEGSAGLETRVAAMSPIAIAVRSLTVEPSSTPLEIDVGIPTVLRVEDWLPYLRIGPLGEFSQRGVTARTGSPGFVVFGPYWQLPVGRYEMSAQIEHKRGVAHGDHLVRADVVVGNRQLVAGNFHLAALPYNNEHHVRLLRFPFTLENPEPDKRQIETRIWSSGEEQFTIRSLSVRAAQRRYQEDLLPFLLIGEVGRRVGGEIRNTDQQVGFVAYSPAIALDAGTYTLSLQVMAQMDADASNLEERPCVFVILKYGYDILAVDAITSKAIEKQDRRLAFEIPYKSDPSGGIEFLVQVVVPADVRLQALAIEPATAVVGRPAVCQIENWLPFLQTKPIARVVRGELLVGEGKADYAGYGPHWSLPAGRYDLVAAVVPDRSRADGKPVITIDVCTGGGQHRIAEHQWRLGQYLDAGGETAVECRLPFTLPADLPESSRIIETRIFTSGEGCFRIRSLSVRPKGDEREHNWFRYLTVSECGVYTDGQIKSGAGKCGCIAGTPAMHIQPGHYQVTLDATTESANAGYDARIGLEMRSGAELVAIGAPEKDQSLEFDVTEELSARGLELRLYAITATVVCIRGLQVQRTADLPAPSRVPAVLHLNSWLPFLQRTPRSVIDEHGIRVRGGHAELALWGPYWRLPPGQYEVVASIVPLASIDDTATNIMLDVCTDRGQRQIAAKHYPDGPRADGKPVITIDVCTGGGQHRFAEHQWRLGQYLDAGGETAVECRLPFTLPADLPESSRIIETRIFTSGEGCFHVRSLSVKPKGDEREHNWFRYLTVSECGVYTDGQIKSGAGKCGCIAGTPAMHIQPGHYQVTLDVTTESANAGYCAPIGLEIRSGAELVAIGAPEKDHSLEFDVTEELSARGLELRLWAGTATVVCISGLLVQCTADLPAPSRVPAVLQVNEWLPFLHRARHVLASERGITVSEGSAQFVLWGPYWQLPPGRYEVSASISPQAPIDDHTTNIILDVCTDSGQNQIAAQQYGLTRTVGNSPPVEYRLTFTLARDLSPTLRTVETRIYTTGEGAFCIHSVMVGAIAEPEWLTGQIEAPVLRYVLRAFYNRAARARRYLLRKLRQDR